jgi:radical SAM protein with 4Fe4S-binding SPASM domain
MLEAKNFCASGVNVASILYDGSISGCLSMRYDYSQGNIYNDSFMEVWNNRFVNYRNHSWMKTGVCEKCEVWRWCEGNGLHLRDNKGDLLLCNYNKMFK